MIELTGSEKQIAWAQDIIAKYHDQVAEYKSSRLAKITEYDEKLKNPRNEKQIERLNRWRADRLHEIRVIDANTEYMLANKHEAKYYIDRQFRFAHLDGEIKTIESILRSKGLI